MVSQFSSSVLSKKILQPEIFKLTLSSSIISKAAKPGNFVHIKAGLTDNPLLRRAFSIHSVKKEKNSFDVLFRIMGKGTEILSRATPGEVLDILGPIGNSFSLPPEGREIMLVAGGMGIAPLWFLFTHLIKKFDRSKLTFFLGAKSKRELLYVEKLKAIKDLLVITTDDGSAGIKGQVTDAFLKEIRRRDSDYRNLVIYSCGPHLMLSKMSEISKSYDLFCQVSLETHMPCGVGACWGCVVKMKDGAYERVCVDGPVFDAREVNF